MLRWNTHRHAGIGFLLVGTWLAANSFPFPAQAQDLVFPAPPAEARLAYLGEISDLEAFSKPRNLIGKLTDWIAGGRQKPQLIQPHGVGLGDDALLVADPETGFVHYFSLADSTWKRIPAKNRLHSPVDAASGPDGVIFISDSGAAQVVACDKNGEILFACDGPFVRPTGLAFDQGSGRLLVADAAAHHLVWVDPDGSRLGTIGCRGTEPGEFNFPIDIALTSTGNILVLDALNFRIQVLDGDGNFVREFGVQGDSPGRFSRPRGLCADAADNILVTDALQDNFQIFDATGRLLLAVGGTGRDPGSFWMPAGICAGTDGRIFVADAYNRRVQVFAYLASSGQDGPEEGSE
ncbi:MAG: hypothetical protein KOO60_08640 [Gemmatimonadales bacterium]|nr:hypothetical protein [Gemmatimonadales bacterium]